MNGNEHRNFGRGIIFITAVRMAYQDHVGKDAFIEHVRQYWIDFPPFMAWVWAATALICLMTIERRQTRCR